MAQVFLSYDRDDGPKARVIAQALERAGHFVWWDLYIKGGAEYGREIEQALEKSDAVVVLWSERSIVSAWVRDEAATGRDAGHLIPVLIEPVTPPMGFRQYQNLDFTSWKGRSRPPRLQELLESIEAMAGPGAEASSPEPARPAPLQGLQGRQVPRWLLVGGIAVLILVVLSIVLPGKGSRGIHTVAVTAADSDANPLARDLLVNLGRLQSAKSGSIRLVSGVGDGDHKPDLIFESASDSDPSRVGASLLLMDGTDRSVLWSKDFNQPSGKMADLKQQIAYSAGRVLGCVVDGLNSEVKLKPNTFKSYLSACSEISETGNENPSKTAATLRQVIADAPRFEPAWSALLIAQSDLTNAALVDDEPDQGSRQELRNLIAAARKVNPNLAEATLAEITLVSANQFGEELRLADKADRESPDNAAVLTVRSNLLRRVGRMRESIDDAHKAAMIDPLDPYISNSYISALYYGGRFEAARQELAKAEQLWPGTDSIADAKLRFDLRYGDPRAALRQVQAQGLGSGMEQFLNARIDPSPQNLATLKSTAENRAKTEGYPGLSSYLQAAGQFGWEESLYDFLIAWPRSEDLGTVGDVYFRPTLKKFRSDPRFMQVAKRGGLLDYWQKSGRWPDFCSEADLPYDCKAEAAKLN